MKCSDCLVCDWYVRVTYLEGPDAMRIFTPGVRGHKWPFGKSIQVVIVVHSFAEDH